MTRVTSHVSKDSTDRDPSEQVSPHLAHNNLVNTTTDAHFDAVRRTTRGTECLPVDLLCIGRFTTVNLERKTSHRSRKNTWSDWNRAPRILDQVNRTLNLHITSKTEEHSNRVYNISIHQDKRYLNTSLYVKQHDTSRIRHVRKQHDTSRVSLRIRHP